MAGKALRADNFQPQALNDDMLWQSTTCVAGSDAVQSGSDISSFIQYLAEAVLVVGSDGIIECANTKAALLLNCVEQPLIGAYWPDFLIGRHQAHYQGIVQIVKTRVLPLQLSPSEMAVICADGSVKDVELSVSYLPSPEHRLVLVIRDMTRYKAEFSQLRTLAATDALTGLANRRAFDEKLREQWLHCTNKRNPLAVLIIDVDHFKQFNDLYGHIHGDACLRKISAVLQNAMPDQTAISARFGGEEFAVILPNHSEIMTIAVARQIQQSIQALRFIDQGLPDHVRISVSQGIACEVNGQYRTCDALLFAADTALYRAKSDGRNCISTSS